MAQFDLAWYCYTARMGCLFEEPATLAHVACPVFLLTAPPAMPGIEIAPGGVVFQQHLRLCEHWYFDDSGHFIMFNQFDGFVGAVHEFVPHRR